MDYNLQNSVNKDSKFSRKKDLQIIRTVPLLAEHIRNRIFAKNDIETFNVVQKACEMEDNDILDLDNPVLKGIITRKEQEIVKKLYEKDDIQEFLSELKELSLKYSAAMHETETKLNILNEDLKIRNGHSCIEHIETRMKSPESILKKMLRNNYPFTIDSMKENVRDIAGVRIICSFKSDIFELVKLIKSIDDFEIVREKDYVTNPKPSGYRSYHIIAKVPIQLSTGKEKVFVEIQIRTIAMDFWASLEHQINYKYDGIVPLEVRKELVECADTVAEADIKMMNLSEKVRNLDVKENSKEVETKEQIINTNKIGTILENLDVRR